MGDVNSLRPGGSGDASGSRDNLLRGGLFVDGVVFLTELDSEVFFEADVSMDGGPRESDRLRRRSDLDRGGVYAVVVVAGASTCGLDDDNGGLIITSSSLGFDVG